MKLHFSCANCGKIYQIEARYAGRRAKGRVCGAGMRVPEAAIELGPVGGTSGGVGESDVGSKDLEDGEAGLGGGAAPAIVIDVPSGRVRAREMAGKKSSKGARWFPIATAFVMGAVTYGAVMLLINAMQPKPEA